MRRLIGTLFTSLLLAGLLLGPAAAAASAATVSRAGFLCYPRGTIASGPSTMLSTVTIDTTTPGNSNLLCYFRATSVPSSFGGACQYEDAAVRIDFRYRLLLNLFGSSRLLCWGGTITFKPDLAISKTDSATIEVPGTAVTYDIVVTNTGLGTVTGATVTDTFPAALTLDTVAKVAFGGAMITAEGPDIADTVTMPPGSSITYTVTALIDPAATGTLTNTATVTPPPGTEDPNPANNSATDSNILEPRADLSITLSDGFDTVPMPATSTWTAIVTNLGPSTATGLSGSASLTIDTSQPIPSEFTLPASLAPGGSTSAIVLAATPVSSFSVVLTVRATVLAVTFDPSLANNTASDTTTFTAPP